ncbi:class E sortase [Streptomyces sp. NBC_01275]|uniref:class E sortase n=1 Tax=Streptomyces sp. NBC_01275 TaxID=2903807 RepID=UPI0022558350|nr:class E sortase [Streptomyces sp. NBC_01275]MCX4762422.1 class E sortase [Streptomyces sp. NBC_01275]
MPVRRVVEHGALRRRARRRRVLWSGAEVLVTAGVLVLLLVVHQLWWTNREARQGAERQVEALERQWGTTTTGDDPSDADAESSSDADSGAGPADRSDSGSAATRPSDSAQQSTTPRPSRAYAVLAVPRLRLRVPVAEGTSKRNVLNKGYVGHYTGTQQPGEAGNFALAGHRNTHGEPFRYLNRLRPKDTVEVETAEATYTYVVDRVLPQTSPRDSGVIRPVPRSLSHPSYGYDAPGRYLTLTTCTPEYTSRYRLVVWGKLTSTRPRG